MILHADELRVLLPQSGGDVREILHGAAHAVELGHDEAVHVFLLEHPPEGFVEDGPRLDGGRGLLL
ncbi:MAG: hypothetical protein KatS3mg131_0308 [Candidatus Tectimicrobiota bacterium]|nr:MAG: hypothetical protein KatS3mg131_0308 [Candidatus Tectomicrobia bacterium]